ncbi:uncharacterized protein UV8b_04882 [Ustilaginoidea virens]|uniref:Transmembrane protein 32 n=1 Tax=Ustilaginoidea virens TaxID=1159556 RepID=A0A8E5MI46_USTVR|nr:uncharacterized protein UV8b_04882 [Ustilaginoidea virens]QUC20641.1 hypothetical protein UV8b_04882 [Ustilaginoidea virens]
MTWFSRTVTFTGLLLLVHSCYSAQEHAAISSALKAPTSNLQNVASSLPIDIRVESILATLIICVGIVVGSENLHPIRWQVWAGKIEREGDAGFIDGSGQVEKNFRGNPYSVLESRPGFLDIRKQRHEFTEWARNYGAK